MVQTSPKTAAPVSAGQESMSTVWVVVRIEESDHYHDEELLGVHMSREKAQESCEFIAHETLDWTQEPTPSWAEVWMSEDLKLSRSVGPVVQEHYVITRTEVQS